LLTDLSIIEYLKKTSSSNPVPGGGSAAALIAALAASLSEMVANLTIGRHEFGSVEKEMKEIANVAAGFRKKLLKDIDNDSEAYGKVLAAFKLPKNTDEEKNQRSKAIQDALKNAALVPLDVARDAFKIMDLADKVIQRGNKNATTDGVVGAMTARTAALSALYNVKINLGSITDNAFVEELTQEVEILQRKIEEKEILSHVKL
jgi:formiminotetrahydrofolate cyclodeaminase